MADINHVVGLNNRTEFRRRCYAATGASDLGQDASFLPATADGIRQELGAAGDNPVKLYEAVYHAGRNRLELAALSDLRALKARNPDNANVLAARCFAYEVASGHFGLNGYHSVFGMNVDENREVTLRNDLAKAEKLDPKLWLIYLLKAQPAIMPGIGDRHQALVDLQTAVRLGPLVPYTHYALAYFLSTPNATPQEQQESIQQAKTAERLKPVDTEVTYLLFQIYAINLHDREKGLAYKQLLLSEVPPSYKLSDGTKQLLANFPR